MSDEELVTLVQRRPGSTDGAGRPVAPSTPDTFDDARYRRERLLGEGGMGRVHLVEDAVIGRHVALKELTSESYSDESARKRFYREALVQGQLEHPSVVPVYDVGVGSDGSPFFTMKRVRGHTLDEIVSELAAGGPSKFTQGKLVTAFAQLCLAVHYAHERGVVHRDIKPANVMLGRYGEVYLLDWGIAKVATEAVTDVVGAGPDDNARTQVGDVVGSLVTMAPEQAAGREVDRRADVYALGAVLFELLTLEPLHPIAGARDMLRAIVAGVESRPSVRRPDRSVAPELEEIIVAATKRDPGERTPTALALHDALQAYLEGDRDLALRRAGSIAHAEQARVAAEAALGPEGSDQLRERALRDVGKALALDPENHAALEILVRLLMTPPKTIPREVHEEQERNLQRALRRGGVAAAAFYAMILLWGVWSWFLGPRDMWFFAIAQIGWALALGASVVLAKTRSIPWLVVTFLFGIATSVWVTTSFGPFLIVPTMISVHAMGFALIRKRGLRIAVVAAACFAWILSVIGGAVGLFPDVVRVTASGVVMELPWSKLDSGGFLLYLFFAGVAAVVAPAMVVASQQNAWFRTDLQTRLQAWQLSRLVG